MIPDEDLTGVSLVIKVILANEVMPGNISPVEMFFWKRYQSVSEQVIVSDNYNPPSPIYLC